MPDHESDITAQSVAAAGSIADEELMVRYAKGDAGAFEELYMRHRGPVFRFILRSMNGDRAAAEDMLQDVMMKVMKAAPRYEAKAKFTTWLYRIARNSCIDAARRRKLEPKRHLEDPTDNEHEGLTLEDTLSDDAASPEDEAADMQTRNAVTHIMGTMNPEQREIFLLREVEGLPFREVAEIVGITESTAKSRMRYAMSYLAKGLEQRGIAPEL